SGGDRSGGPRLPEGEGIRLARRPAPPAAAGPRGPRVIPRPENPLVVALDLSDADRAVRLELLAAHGPAIVERLRSIAPVFLDPKLHDIPTTVERAARNYARLGIAMLTVHALGGEAMVAAAVRGAGQGAAEAGHATPLIAAVTVLSSLGGEGLASPASLAFEAGAAGAAAAVVSGEDVREVREVMGEEFCLVVPGIRPPGSNGHDQ